MSNIESKQESLVDRTCDSILGFYGRIPLPHKGRDRAVAFLSERARHCWTGKRRMRRRGFLLETDLSVDDVGWTLYGYGCLDYWDERAVLGMLEPGANCIDVGAHIGYYSLLMARQVGASGHVYGFEPQPYTHDLLDRNLKLNHATNVTVRQAAIGSRQGVVHISIPQNGRLGWSTVSESDGVEVPSTTIDAEVARLGLKRLDFIKTDTEGYELEVLVGAAETMQSLQPRIMLEINMKALGRHNCSALEIQRFLHSHGYHLCVAGRDGLQPIHEIVELHAYFNIFALPSTHTST